jgi:dihydropteroate synthase
MGVVNLSADSWYRESVCLTAEAAVQRGKVLAAQGADIVDIGAESTLAHAARVDDAAQKSKLIPVIKELRAAKSWFRSKPIRPPSRAPASKPARTF